MIFACVRACVCPDCRQGDRKGTMVATLRRSPPPPPTLPPSLPPSLLPFALVTRNSLSLVFSIFAHSCLFTSAKQPSLSLSLSLSLSWLLHLSFCPFSFLQCVSQIVLYMTNGRAWCREMWYRVHRVHRVHARSSAEDPSVFEDAFKKEISQGRFAKRIALLMRESWRFQRNVLSFNGIGSFV